MEGFAHEILHQYRNDRRPRKTYLIAVTLDMPNHGDREISGEANLSWDSGNETHGPDMLSLISASASDFGILFDYFPSYIPGRFKKFYNIAAGVSLEDMSRGAYP
ncbi:alpha beta hydrolase family domain protein [Penicillium daleae]|uniref:Alpha beta hydrolase family domain protein n=1 Tax=Penicillium daleae TaxID=63821 RepID=A0AAD6CHR2_9EURO|nr:alpha beta hydrolase family domain protein [Penicillium daleae]KAJ5465338.1 alpha beta hydrolase family domain protein [Penicillium daleae]